VSASTLVPVKIALNVALRLAPWLCEVVFSCQYQSLDMYNTCNNG